MTNIQAALPGRLAFLQRSGEQSAPLGTQPMLAAGPEQRAEVHVIGVAREWHEEDRVTDQELWKPSTAPFISAMHTSGLPIYFRAGTRAGGLHLNFGTWTSSVSVEPSQHSDALVRLLRSAEIEVDIRPGSSPAPPFRPGVSGFLLGHPTVLVPTARDPSGLLDRLVRSTNGTDWDLTVVARPVSEDQLLRVRDAALNELRDVSESEEAKRITAPLAQYYRTIVQSLVDHLGHGLRVGCWRVATYITVAPGHSHTYPVIAGAIRGLVNGEHSSPEPVRLFADPHAAVMAESWAMADTGGRPGPGLARRLYEYQSLLNSSQLATYVHLPEQETPGFAVRRHVRFDTEPGTPATGPRIALGAVMSGDRGANDQPFWVGTEALRTHVFVPGVTGAGKTNTIFHILTSLPGVPFLVLEPAKTEYRALLTVLPSVTVYTVGRESVAPLRMNPFEVVPSATGLYDVAAHIDQLRSLFVACFGLWNPLPAVLEQALYAIYAARGWDLRTQSNPRLDDPANVRLAFPVMTDLARAVEEVIGQLGYNRDVADNLRGALSVRINALRLGAKGRMLDTRTATPMAELFTRSVVIELEGLGDGDDKAFMMGLLLIQLAALRRAAGPSDRLEHVLVVEEAHRLLRNAHKGTQEANNSAAKAVESFGDLLAEVRAYGQGVIVADQVPVDLAPVVLKNTNLKIVHRLVAQDDREAVGAAMVMTPQQIKRLATLSPGSAVVFAEGQDSPLLVTVDQAPAHDQRVSDAAIAQSALPPPSDCPGDLEVNGACCRYAVEAVESPSFRIAYARLAVAATVGGDVRWEQSDVADLVDAVVAPGVPRDSLERCVLGRGAQWLADRRGAQYGWTFGQTLTWTSALRTTFGAALRQRRSEEDVMRFQSVAVPLHRRTHDPFPNCYRICPDDTCVHRGSATDATARNGRLLEVWNAVHREPAPESGDRTPNRRRVTDVAGQELAGLDCGEPIDDRRSGSVRAGLCFAQHAVRTSTTLNPNEQRDVISSLVRSYHPAPTHATIEGERHDEPGIGVRAEHERGHHSDVGSESILER